MQWKLPHMIHIPRKTSQRFPLGTDNCYGISKFPLSVGQYFIMKLGQESVLALNVNCWPAVEIKYA